MPRKVFPITLFVRFRLAAALVALGLAGAAATRASNEPSPHDYWLDLVSAEETDDAAVLDDLAAAQVIYVGETHTIDRHHAIQLGLLRALAARGIPLALCLEQIEAAHQPTVDRFNAGELDFDALAAAIEWKKSWRNYADYRALLEFAREQKIPVRALNAPAAVIRAISRGGGLANLPADQRARLPDEIVTDDPPYEKLMGMLLAVHMAMDPAKLRPVFEAQVARDEAMSEAVVAARGDTSAPRVPFVVVGSGHIRHGLGLPDRVARRAPGIAQRIVLATVSGQLRLSEAERAAARPIAVPHAALRDLGRPAGDYLRVLPLGTAGPPGEAPPAQEASTSP